MYVDAGKPIPGLVEITARNLKEVAPTLYFNVPRGYDLLLPLLEKDAELRRNFFRDLEVLFTPPRRCRKTSGTSCRKSPRPKAARRPCFRPGARPRPRRSPLPCIFRCSAGVIGLPVAECELKLVPAAGKLEVRVRGPNVTPGYYKRPDLTKRRSTRKASTASATR